MREFLKIKVGRHTWLVPDGLDLITPEFKSAVQKFNETKDGEIARLTDEEYKAFLKVREYPATWVPF